MQTVVPSPLARPSRFGLVASLGGEAGIRQAMADTPSEGGLDRWENGYEIGPYDCLVPSDAFAAACADTPDFTADESQESETISVTPVGLWSRIDCSTFSGESAVQTQRAEAKLTALTSYYVEREIWAGAVGSTYESPNQALKDPNDVVGDAAYEPVLGLASLVDQFGECSGGARAMVHAPVAVVYAWLQHGILRRDAGLLLDALDNIFVPGTGYDGTGPEAVTDGVQWVFATEIIDLRLSDIRSRTIEFTDQTNNNRFAVASRVSGASWNPCCHLGVRIDPALCCGSGGEVE